MIVGKRSIAWLILGTVLPTLLLSRWARITLIVASGRAMHYLRNHYGLGITLVSVLSLGLTFAIIRYWRVLLSINWALAKEFLFLCALLAAVGWIFALVPLYMFYHPVIAAIGDFAYDSRPWYFLLVFMGLFVVTFLSLRRSKTDEEKFVHVVVLVVTFASFYAFGFPTEFAKLRPTAEELSEALAHRFAELCVILVLFLLSELAVRLNYDAREIREGLRQDAAAIEEQLKQSTSTYLSSIDQAKGPILQAGNAMIDARAGIQRGADELQAAVSTLRDFLKKLQDQNRVLSATDTFPERLRTEASVAAAKWIEGWSEFFRGISGDLTVANVQLGFVSGLFREYAAVETAGFAGHLSYPPRLLVDAAGQPFPEHWDRSTVKVLRLNSSDQLYSDLLSAIADKARMIALDVSQNAKILYMAISNLLPADWFNWQRPDGSLSTFKGLTEYIWRMDKIIRLPNVDYTRIIVVDGNDGYRLRSSLRPSHRVRSGSQSKTSLAPFLATEKDLEFDLSEFWGVMLSDKETGAYSFRPCRAGEAGQIFAGIPDPKKRKRSHTALKRLFGQPASADEVFPIFSTAELRAMGVDIPATMSDGQIERRYGTVSFAIKSLRELFLERVHAQRNQCHVFTLKDNDDLDLFPDRKTDILEIGYEENGTKKWVLALATALIPGESVLSMRVITDIGVLEHIANLKRHFEMQEKLRSIESITGSSTFAAKQTG